MTDMESISRIRTAASWLRRTGQPLESYKRLSTLSETERVHAKNFALGTYPWPSRWTVRLFTAASAG
jgi:hypothetical protein